jgi:probable rRNA maturation factor
VSGLEVETVGLDLAPGAPPPAEIERLLALAIARAGICDGHVAVCFVDADDIAALNAEHRGKEGPTDVLSFPIDEDDPDVPGPRELGDIVICPEHTENLVEAVVHGALHLCGYDHETDNGEMFDLQDRVMESLER